MRGPKRRDIGHGALAERALVAGGAEHRGLPVHDPRRVGHPRVQRLVLDGLGVRLLAGADGRRRADQASRWPASRWASSRRATTTSSSPTSRASRTTSATWTSRSPAPRTGSPPCRWTSRSRASPSRSCATRSPRPRRPACRSSARCTRPSPAPRDELSPHAPRILTVADRPGQDRPAHRQGRRDHPRACRTSSRRRSTSTTTARSSSTRANGELGEALAERIRTMTKEVEVGDEFTGKVVKTTTFGAFVELAKGTDGLLHISNVSPGPAPRRRSRTSSTRATRSSVRVVEVDRERGRIGLRLADDPDIAGKTVGGARLGRHAAATAAARGATATVAARGATAARAAAATVTAAARRPRLARLRPPAAPQRRRTATPTAARRRAPRARRASPDGARLGRPDRHGAHGLRPLRRARLLDRHGLVRRGRARGRAQAPHRAHALPRHRALRVAARSTSSSTRWAPSSTRARARRRPPSTRACSTVHLERGLRRHGRHGLAPARSTTDELAQEREIVLEEIAMYEDDPQDKVFDVLGEAVFGGHPLGRAIIGRAEVVGGAGPGRAAGLPRRALRARPTSSSRRPARSTTTRSSSSSARAGVERPGQVARRRCRRPPDDEPPRMRFVAKDTEQYHVCLGAPGHPARRRAPLRAARARQHPRRHVVVAAVPGGPREARPGLQRLLVPVAVRRDGPGRPVPRHAARTTSSARWASSPTSSSASARSPATADELERSKENVKGRIVLVARVDDGADEPPRRVGAGRHAAADASTRSSERIDAVDARRPRRAGRASCSRPSA